MQTHCRIESGRPQVRAGIQGQVPQRRVVARWHASLPRWIGAWTLHWSKVFLLVPQADLRVGTVGARRSCLVSGPPLDGLLYGLPTPIHGLHGTSRQHAACVTRAEDETLKSLIRQYGRNWDTVAAGLNGRPPEACRMR
jgi:hypothetical protein